MYLKCNWKVFKKNQKGFKYFQIHVIEHSCNYKYFVITSKNVFSCNLWQLPISIIPTLVYTRMQGFSFLILQAENLRIAGLPADTEINPYVKAFLVPGRTFKYRTKTIPKTKVSPNKFLSEVYYIFVGCSTAMIYLLNANIN